MCEWAGGGRHTGRGQASQSKITKSALCVCVCVNIDRCVCVCVCLCVCVYACITRAEARLASLQVRNLRCVCR